MNDPLIHAFFVGRALAEAIGEQLENAFTNTLSDLGRFDAEQRERLRQFTDEVLERARVEQERTMQNRGTATTVVVTPPTQDVQTMIDDLRAETAQLRAELQQYRNRSAS